VSKIGHELVKDHSYQMGVETKHGTYHWKGLALPYTMYGFDFPFETIIGIELDREFTVIGFSHSGDANFVPSVRGYTDSK